MEKEEKPLEGIGEIVGDLLEIVIDIIGSISGD